MGVGRVCFFLLGFWCGIFVGDMRKAIEKRRLLVQHGSGTPWEFSFYSSYILVEHFGGFLILCWLSCCIVFRCCVNKRPPGDLLFEEECAMLSALNPLTCEGCWMRVDWLLDVLLGLSKLREMLCVLNCHTLFAVHLRCSGFFSYPKALRYLCALAHAPIDTSGTD